MSKKIWWIIIGLVGIIAVLIALKKTGVIGKEDGIKVTTEKVVKRTVIETVNASGKVYPEVEVKVSSDISGEIVELTVDEGDSVKRGQVLAKIYADIYGSQRDQAAAGVNLSQAQVLTSQAQLNALKATFDQGQVTFDRQKKLLDDKVISRAEFEQADQALKSARASYNAALAGIEGNKASVQSAQAQLTRANKDVSRATIVAPMDGIVSLLAVKKGERVVGTAQMAGTEMLRIADLKLIEVRVNVGENDIPKVHLGDSALVEVDAYSDRKFKGIVTKIASSSTSAGQSTGAISSTEVTNYEVHVRLLPQDYQDLLDPSRPKSFPFRPGMNASADIQTKTHSNVLSVPINAVTTRDKKGEVADAKSTGEKQGTDNSDVASNVGSGEELEEVVYVLQKDMTVKRVKVRTSIQDINSIEVLSGLKEGDEVITGPYSVVSKTLNDGDKVTIESKDKIFDDKK